MTIKRVSVVLATLAIALLAAAVGPAAAGSRTLVVDDDKQQCPQAHYTSINAAIAAAAQGDKIEVCPGLYNETVVVDKAGLSLQGSTNGSATGPCLRGDDAASPTRDSVVNGAVRLEANGVSLDSFTVQGAPVTPVVLAPAGINTSASFSGYVIRRDVVQNNPAGINLKSNGVDPTLVDHNCIRRNNVGEDADNTAPLGIFAEQGLLSNARIEANTFTGHDSASMFLGYGLTAFPIITAPDTSLTISDNLSVDDGFGGILVSNVSGVEISHNKIIRTGNAIEATSPASNVVINYNDIEDSRFTGIRVDGDPFGCCFFPTGPTNITVAHNHVSGAGTLFPQDGIALNRTSSDTVLDNLVEGSSRNGIGVRNSNDNLVSGNHADGNGRDGIRNRGTSSGNTFEGNHMSGNAEHDAHDENRSANTWTGNHCDTDFPAGTICGQ
jgi:parallel beta-helix repeat protein